MLLKTRARCRPIGKLSSHRKSRRSINSFAPRVFQQSRYRNSLSLTFIGYYALSKEERGSALRELFPISSSSCCQSRTIYAHYRTKCVNVSKTEYGTAGRLTLTRDEFTS